MLSITRGVSNTKRGEATPNGDQVYIHTYIRIYPPRRVIGKIKETLPWLWAKISKIKETLPPPPSIRRGSLDEKRYFR